MFVFSAILLTLSDPSYFLYSIFAFSPLIMFPCAVPYYIRGLALRGWLSQLNDAHNLVIS